VEKKRKKRLKRKHRKTNGHSVSDDGQVPDDPEHPNASKADAEGLVKQPGAGKAEALDTLEETSAPATNASHKTVTNVKIIDEDEF